jgi:hypothetical protein
LYHRASLRTLNEHVGCPHPSADTGHIGSSLDEQIEEQTDTFAFVFKELGMAMQGSGIN